MFSLRNKLVGVGALSFFSLAASALALALWRCQFGFDGMDEAFYLVTGFKLVPLGDQFFSNEILSGPRQHDLLNYLFVRPFVAFSVFQLRVAAVLLYASLLLVFTLTCFKKKLGLIAGLVYFICLVFDYFLMPTWSYNWWLRNSLLLHHISVISAVSVSRRSFRRLLNLAAGSFMAVAVISYNPMILMAGFCLSGALIWAFVHKDSQKVMVREFILPYFSGFVLWLGLDLLFIVGKGLAPGWWRAFETVSQERYTHHFRSAEKQMLHSVTAFLGAKEAYGFLILFGLFTTKMVDWLWWILLGLVGAFILWQIGTVPPGSILVKQLVLPMATSGALVLILYGLKNSNFLAVLLGSAGLFGMIVAGGVSVNRAVAGYFLAPLLIIPLGALISHSYSAQLSALRVGVLQGLWVVIFLGVGVGCVSFIVKGVYRDLPPRKAKTEFSVEPLKGIYTNARRAYLYEKISALVQGKRFVLAYDLAPLVFLFGNVRSAVNSAQVDSLDKPRQRSLKALRFMVEQQRVPELIIQAKKHPWHWGLKGPYLNYKHDNVFVRFTECAKSDLVTEEDEFVAFSVETANVEKCVSSLENKALAFKGK